MPLNWVDGFFPIIYMFISYLIFIFNEVIYFSHSGTTVVYLVVLFIVIMCRDGTYRLHVSLVYHAYWVTSLGH